MCKTDSAVSVYINEAQDKMQDNYALYLISTGYAKINLDHTDYYCVSPAILCLNDTQRLYIRSGDNLTVSAVFFTPEFLSKGLTRTAIRSTSLQELCQSYDFLMLLPFIGNDLTASVHNNIPQHILCDAQTLLKDCDALLRNGSPLSLYRVRAKLIDCLHLCETAVSGVGQRQAQRLKTMRIPEGCADVRMALGIIWDSYSDPAVNTAYLLEQLHVHKEKLNKQFQQVLGISPYQYILQYRLSVACDKLLHTDDTIDRISELCGFTTYVTFTTIFKKKFGISPRAFRLNGQNIQKQNASA